LFTLVRGKKIFRYVIIYQFRSVFNQPAEWSKAWREYDRKMGYKGI
jgi:hypothetical protein